MIGNPYPQFQNVQEWNDFVNEVRHVLARTERTLEDIKARVLAGEGEYDFPEATDEEAGVLKLYGTTGTSEDGTITQKGITQAINDARYTLPSATETRLGGVKVGDRLTVDENGQLSADDQSYTLPIASDSILGGVKIGQGLEIEEDGTLNAAGEYLLPIASDSVLGGVKIGEGLNIDENGVVSSDSGGSGTLKSCYAVVESEAVANSYFKIGSGSLSRTYNSCNIIILVQDIMGNGGSGLWLITLNVGNTAGVFTAGTSTIAINTRLPASNFIVAYKSNSGGSLQFEIYCNITVRYAGYKFTILQEIERYNQVIGEIVTLSNGTTTNGQSAITSGFTALTTQNATVDGNVTGNATTATTAYNIPTQSGNGNIWIE